jgi:predicted PurR-regulated permease PerM
MAVKPILADEPPEQSPEPVVPSPVSSHAVALGVLAALGVILLLRYAADVFIPLVLGVLVSYALEPLVEWLQRWWVPRGLAAALVVLTIVAGVGGGAWALSDDALQIVRDLPPAARRVRESLRTLRQPGGESPIAQVEELATEIEKSAAAAAAPDVAPPPGVTRVQVEEKPLDVRSYFWTGSMGLLGLASQGILLFFLVYFLLSTGDLYKRKLVRIVGAPLSRKRVTVEVLDEISTQIQRFLLVQVFTSAVVAVASWLAFRSAGLEHAGVWAVLAGLFNSIPYFGPFIVMAGVAMVAFLQFGTFEMAVYLAALSFAITTVEGFLLTPWLIGRAARMNEVAVFVGLLFWAWMWGVIGMLLAVPIMVTVKAVCDRVEDLKPIGELLGD